MQRTNHNSVSGLLCIRLLQVTTTL